MATVTGSVWEISGHTARIELAVSGAASGDTMTVTRVDVDAEEAVLGAVELPAASTILDDPAVPLNRPVTWRVVLSTGEVVVLGPITVQSVWPILSDPHAGVSVRVAIVDMGDRDSAQRGKAIDIEETSDVVFVWDVESAARWPLELLTYTDAERRTFDRLAGAGGPLLLRAACPIHDVGWFARDGGSRRSRKLRKYQPRDERWAHEFTSVVVVGAQRPGERPTSDTLADVVAAAPSTLGAIAAQWSTLGAIAADDLRGS